MNNYITYISADETEIMLRLTAGRAIRLEEKLGGSIPKKLAELDKLSVATEFIAAGLPSAEYKERKQRAAEIYDEMIANGKSFDDYQFLVMDMLVAAGFMKGETVELQKLIKKTAQKNRETALAEAKEKAEVSPKSSVKTSPQPSLPVSATAIIGE